MVHAWVGQIVSLFLTLRALTLEMNVTLENLEVFLEIKTRVVIDSSHKIVRIVTSLSNVSSHNMPLFLLYIGSLIAK